MAATDNIVIEDADLRNPSITNATKIVADDKEFLVSTLEADLSDNPLVILLSSPGYTETQAFRRSGDGEYDFEELTEGFFASPADHQAVVDRVVEAVTAGTL